MNKFEILKELLQSNRSYRRFNQKERIDKNHLENLIELTRYCSSGRNLQPLRYMIITEEEICDEIFPLLGWAGYLKDWPGPDRGERPAAYILQFLDTELTGDCMCDDGLQLETITLGAVAKGLGCCIIKSFNSKKLIEILGIEERYQPLYVVAVGYPVETVKIEDMTVEDTDIKYYRTADAIHHVPKRPISSLIIPKRKI